MNSDTIAAISTAVSESGIGIIRISGKEAFQIIDRIYRINGRKKYLSEAPSHTIHYGFIYDGEELIDEVLIMLMRAPRSFTSEDTVEINCHGGVYAMKRVMETVLKYGARPAEPGEFTKRAFLNGRIDLSQAEAVIDVIQAKNEYALKSSVSQLRGSVFRAISEIRSRMIYEIAYIESALDDPEHISLDGFNEKLRRNVEKWKKQIHHLIETYDNGRVIREGIKTVIIGKPNAGKSSLLNALMGEDRAIVTDIAGTTRDILRETVQINGITLNIADTAGIRITEDIIEQIGVRKAEEQMEDADLIIYVVDSSTVLDENDEKIINKLERRKVIILLNKSDLEILTNENEIEKRIGNHPVISVSAKNGEGIDRLEQTLHDMFYEGNISFNDEVYITNMRQKNLLAEAENSLIQVENSLDLFMPEDFLTIDLMDSYEKLGQITGETAGEDLINEIFSKFCMGK